MPTLVDRKRTELEAKGKALEREFTHWRAVSEANGAFEKHHSQIRRITARLTGILENIATDREKLAADEVLTRGVQIEQKTLAAHLVWEFFRSRIALRADDYLRKYLGVCDEFAWACWKPFLDRQAVRKEPPLVFLNGGWSPFAVSRDLSFKMDRPGFATDGPAVAWLETGEFVDAIDKLPVPMIGVPWFQVNHLPDALVLGHEMGHVIETDFGLTPDLERAVRAAGVGDTRLPAWLEWRRETFADVFGTLAGGPRFGYSLMDFLSGDRKSVAGELRAAPRWGRYPSRWMRIGLVAETLRHMAFDADADQLEADWKTEFGDPAHNSDFKNDLAPIVRAILTGPYDPIAKDGDATLNGVLTFRRDAIDRPMDIALADGIRGLGAVTNGTAPEFVAAARVLFAQSPLAYEQNGYADAICSFIEQFAPKGTRGTLPADLDKLADDDARAGAEEGL